jgi:hypothetical protein
VNQRILRQWLPHLNSGAGTAASKCIECAKPGGVLGYFRQRDDGVRLQSGWCCSPNCFERAAEREFRQLSAQRFETSRRAYRMPLGLILLSRGVIDRAQLSLALESQRSAGHGRIGEWLQKLGCASEQEITKALSVQWGCPVLRSGGAQLASGEWLPSSLAALYGMAPVQYIPSNRKLYIACSNGIDRSALLAIEQMLDCRTEPCVIEESALKRHLELPQFAGDEIVFGSQSPTEMTRICVSYALQLHAGETRIVRCSHYIWTRLKYQSGALNLLFHA